MSSENLPPALYTMTAIAPFFLFFIALGFRAFFAFMETTVTIINMARIRKLAYSYPQYSLLLNDLQISPQRILIMILFFSSLADMITGAIASHVTRMFFLRYKLSGGLGTTCGIAIASLCIILFGEIIPKNLARRTGICWFKTLMGVVHRLYRICYYFVHIMTHIAELCMAPFCPPQTIHADQEVTQEIKNLVEYAAEKSFISKEYANTITTLLTFGNIPVTALLSDTLLIRSCDTTTPIDQLRTYCQAHKINYTIVHDHHSRKIIGYLTTAQLFASPPEENVYTISHNIKQLPYISEKSTLSMLYTLMYGQTAATVVGIYTIDNELLGIIDNQTLDAYITGKLSIKMNPSYVISENKALSQTNCSATYYINHPNVYLPRSLMQLHR